MVAGPGSSFARRLGSAVGDRSGAAVAGPKPSGNDRFRAGADRRCVDVRARYSQAPLHCQRAWEVGRRAADDDRRDRGRPARPRRRSGGIGFPLLDCRDP